MMYSTAALPRDICSVSFGSSVHFATLQNSLREQLLWSLYNVLLDNMLTNGFESMQQAHVTHEIHIHHKPSLPSPLTLNS